jgi:hypothetical protein
MLGAVVRCALLGLAVMLASSSPSLANPPNASTLETVDNGLCGFPLDVTMTNAKNMHAVGASVRFTGQAKVLLTNLTTGQTAKLNASGPVAFNGTTQTLSFWGHQLWFGGFSPPGVPYESTDGPASFDSNFVLSTANSNATVIDPCALVGPTPTVTPVSTPAPWGLPTDALSQIGFAGLTPIIGNTIRHDHDHLDVIVNGQAVVVPAGVGQAEPFDTGPCGPGFNDGDCATGNLYFAAVADSPLHTHSTSGIIHVEADRPAVFTLGEFFDEWGVRFNQNCLGGYCTGGVNELRVYVNGNQVTGDPRSVVLGEHQEIAVIYGGPGAFNSVPSVYNGGWPDAPGGGCGGTGEPSCNP